MTRRPLPPDLRLWDPSEDVAPSCDPTTMPLTAAFLAGSVSHVGGAAVEIVAATLSMGQTAKAAQLRDGYLAGVTPPPPPRPVPAPARPALTFEDRSAADTCVILRSATIGNRQLRLIRTDVGRYRCEGASEEGAREFLASEEDAATVFFTVYCRTEAGRVGAPWRKQ